MTTTDDLRAQYDEEAFRALLLTERGRAVVNWMLNLTGFRTSSFTGDDAHTNYQEGRRSVGMALFNVVMNLDSQAYVRMTNEYADREAMFRSRADPELED